VIISDGHAMLQYLRKYVILNPPVVEKNISKIRNIFVNINFILLLIFIIA